MESAQATTITTCTPTESSPGTPVFVFRPDLFDFDRCGCRLDLSGVKDVVELARESASIKKQEAMASSTKLVQRAGSVSL